ncbi:MAG: AAA family ATPase [Thermoplasmata archaeon]|nr:AAA family ATPase [Thermoplasmata archaeon]
MRTSHEPRGAPHAVRPAGAIIAIEGISGSGKSTLLRALNRREGDLVIGEAWERLRPRPSLEPRNRPALRRLELRLLEEERRRAREARARAASGATVWLDTGFVGPVTYARALAALSPRRWEVQKSLLPREEYALFLPDLTVYLDPPPGELLRRALGSESTHNRSLIARHLAVGLVEREFWLEEFRAAFPERLVRIRSRESGTLLARSQGRWRARARAAGASTHAESARFRGLLARPGRLPVRFSGGADNR